MADLYTKKKRSQIMARIKGKNTKPEKLVRSLIYSLGYRFRIHFKGLPGKPDIVFPGRRKVIFIHGCFWHGHEGCKRSKIPSTNTAFWETKINKNRSRDALVTTELANMGWQVLTLWQCQIKDIEQLKSLLISFLGERYPKSHTE